MTLGWLSHRPAVSLIYAVHSKNSGNYFVSILPWQNEGDNDFHSRVTNNLNYGNRVTNILTTCKRLNIKRNYKLKRH